jgi:hypothetical protein
MDVHIPAAVSRGLRLRGIDVLTAQGDAHQKADDSRLLDRATELGRTWSVRMMISLLKPCCDNAMAQPSVVLSMDISWNSPSVEW